VFALMGQFSFGKGSETCIVHIVLYFTIYSMKKLLIAMVFVLFLSSFVSAAEVNDAITWLYQNGLTKYSNANDFMATRSIRRDEASKFFSQFATNVLKQDTRTTTPMCAKFSDVTMQNTMRGFVVDACVLGYMQ